MRLKLQHWTSWWKTQIGWKDQTIKGANEYIPMDFWDNLNDWMYPYLHRLRQEDYIDTSMMYAFAGEAQAALMELRVLAAQADWEWEHRQKSYINRLRWRWENKRLTKYGYADFERLQKKDVTVPLL